jgi:hypothetical protein
VVDELRFAVCTFERIFVTEPIQEVVSLQQLTDAFRRFALKEKLYAQGQRELKRAEEAWQAWTTKVGRSGRQFARLRRAFNDAKKKGIDPDSAVEQEYNRMLRQAINSPKNGLRVWSPSLYAPDTDRHSENVISVSCLVLDFDAGVTIEEASQQWGDWFHIVHTTWNHKPDDPRFRLVLPLAHPVRGVDWEGVWLWAFERSGGRIDKAGKSPSNTFAMPAVGAADWPKVAFSRPGGLLNPTAEGLVKQPAEPPPDTSGVAPKPDWYFFAPSHAERFVVVEDQAAPRTKSSAARKREPALVIAPEPGNPPVADLDMGPAMAAVKEAVAGLDNPLGNYDLEVELSLAFDADGRFLGLGVPGNAIIKVRVRV